MDVILKKKKKFLYKNSKKRKIEKRIMKKFAIKHYVYADTELLNEVTL